MNRDSDLYVPLVQVICVALPTSVHYNPLTCPESRVQPVVGEIYWQSKPFAHSETYHFWRCADGCPETKDSRWAGLETRYVRHLPQFAVTARHAEGCFEAVIPEMPTGYDAASSLEPGRKGGANRG